MAAFHQTAEVEITNLTHATYFTPLLVASHDDGFHLFEPGMPASAPLQAPTTSCCPVWTASRSAGFCAAAGTRSRS